MTIDDERKGYAIENLGNGVTTIVAEMARMRHEIARLKGELERVQTESADAFHHRDGPPPYPSNSELLVRLSEENERLQDKLTAMRIVQKEEHEILDKLSEENDQLKDHIKKLKFEVGRIQDNYDSVARVMKDWGIQLSRLHKENERLQEELAQPTVTLCAEHQRAERILAALREPSGAVVEAGCIARFGSHNWAQNGDGEDEWRCWHRSAFGQQLVAAVAAAEQEVKRAES